MTRNVGTVDRVIRLVTGAVLIALAFFSGMSFFDSQPVTIVSTVVGLVLVGTALVNFCPLYRLLGIRTCRI